jgi:lysozyme family protein
MTMTKTFSDALTVVLKEEGGFANNPKDPGGMTNLGVTERAWQGYVHHAVNEMQMRALTPEQVTPFYRTEYWDKVAGDQLGPALGLLVFDFAVNHGPSGASGMLQRIVGATADGAIGPGTLRAVQAYVGSVGLTHLIGQYGDARAKFYRSLPTFATFGKGWLARVDYVEGVALSWVG